MWLLMLLLNLNKLLILKWIMMRLRSCWFRAMYILRILKLLYFMLLICLILRSRQYLCQIRLSAWFNYLRRRRHEFLQLLELIVSDWCFSIWLYLSLHWILLLFLQQVNIISYIGNFSKNRASLLFFNFQRKPFFKNPLLSNDWKRNLSYSK